MPCIKCTEGKWKWGTNGKCIYNSKSECEKAGLAILIDKINKLRESLNRNLKEYGQGGL
jgi:hypothetical protein